MSVFNPPRGQPDRRTSGVYKTLSSSVFSFSLSFFLLVFFLFLSRLLEECLDVPTAHPVVLCQSRFLARRGRHRPSALSLSRVPSLIDSSPLKPLKRSCGSPRSSHVPGAPPYLACDDPASTRRVPSFCFVV